MNERTLKGDYMEKQKEKSSGKIFVGLTYKGVPIIPDSHVPEDEFWYYSEGKWYVYKNGKSREMNDKELETIYRGLKP